MSFPLYGFATAGTVALTNVTHDSLAPLLPRSKMAWSHTGDTACRELRTAVLQFIATLLSFPLLLPNHHPIFDDVLLEAGGREAVACLPLRVPHYLFCLPAIHNNGRFHAKAQRRKG
jgi:hypothetical protein